jgi:hypothetical protein
MEGDMGTRDHGTRRTATAVVLTGSLLALVLCPGSGTAGAQSTRQATGKEISAYTNSENPALLGQVRKMKCKLKTKNGKQRFHAGGKTVDGAYGLTITILDFKGFKQSYPVPFGVLSPAVDFEGVSNPADYSNVFPFPGGTPPPGGAGQIAFSHSGGRVGLGINSLPSRDYRQGVALAGGARCIYPS